LYIFKRSSCGWKKLTKRCSNSRTSSGSLQSSQLLKPKELLLYIAATTHVVSTAIAVEWQEEGHTYKV
jgi:hypothetical protein